MLHHNRLIKRKLKNLTSPSDCRLLTAPTIFWWSSLIECDNFNVSISPCLSTSVNTTCDKSAMLTFGGILHRAWDSSASGFAGQKMASARLLCVVRQDFYQQVHGVLRRNLLRKQQVSILLTFQVVFIHVNTILYSDSWIVNIAKFHRYTVCARSGHLKCLIWTHWRRLKWTLIDYLVPLCHNNDYISCCLVKGFLTFLM